jgi:hypothetical protein
MPATPLRLSSAMASSAVTVCIAARIVAERDGEEA